MKHTSLPWIMKENLHFESHPYRIYSDNGDIIADIVNQGIETEANAELVVRAVNSHYEFLEACKEALYVLNRTGADLAIEELLKRAIAKAEGKE